MTVHPHSIVIQRKDFHIEYPGTQNARLKHPLVHYDTHRFKQLKEIDILSRRAKDPSNVSVFECSHANKTGCPCRFVLRDDQTGEVVGVHTQDQMHVNDVHSWRLFKAKSLIVDALVDDPFVAPQKILDKLFRSPEFVIDQFTPPKTSLQNAISRLRTTIFGQANVDPSMLSDYLRDVRTLDGKRFVLLEDTYQTEQSMKRIVVLSSQFQIDIARRRGGMFMGDGTFEFVPSIFAQMYTIHAMNDTTSFPVVFALMEEKTTRAYEILFNVLKDNGVVVNVFMSDFEKRSRNAVRRIYPDVQVKGCWFHYTQSIMRRVKRVGLQREYASVPFVNVTVRRLFALAFVPEAEVAAAVDMIDDEISECGNGHVAGKLNELMIYFKKTWLRKYPPIEWNQCADCSFRSNNFSESFHAAFSRRFARGHPNIRVAVEALKTVENEVHVLWNEFRCALPKQTNLDLFTDELERVMRARSSHWRDDLLGYVDALSRIPVRILLRYEKNQLEFTRANVKGAEHQTFDSAERRLSEVTSLINTDSVSLVETRGVNPPNEQDVGTMQVITKQRLAERKRRLIERIERLTGGPVAQRPATELAQGSVCGDANKNGDDASEIHRPTLPVEDAWEWRGVDEAREVDLCCCPSENNGTENVTTRPRHARRRKSVVAKMNAAIKRRRAKRRL